MTTDDDRSTRVDQWCVQAGFGVAAIEVGRQRIIVDERAGLTFDVDLGGGTDPLRIEYRFRLDPASALSFDQDVVEGVVLGRSAMIDGRFVGPDLVEIVVVVYPEGLNRHTFMTAVFEIQKVQALIRREGVRRAADTATIAELERLVAESAD